MRIVTLGGKLLKNFMSAQKELFENKIGWHLVCEDDDYSCINNVYR
jgi:hypothetical protein